MNILEVKNLSKIYGKGDTLVKAVDDVSFTVEQGEFVAIIGPSGSGKSTLLHIIGGVDTPTTGNVIVDGTDITKLKESPLSIFRRRQIGLVYQFYNLIPILTVEENLTLPLLLDGRKPNKEQIDYLVSNLGLGDRLKHLPNQLSGGQQQRVSIGRALANNPALLLADEPTGNLDSENSKEIVALLRKFNREHNQTVIMITHDERIAQSADRIIAIEDGDDEEYGCEVYAHEYYIDSIGEMFRFYLYLRSMVDYIDELSCGLLWYTRVKFKVNTMIQKANGKAEYFKGDFNEFLEKYGIKELI